MAAAEHLFTARKTDVNFHEAAMHRGWPLTVKTVPLKPARPSGWLAKPSGLAAWAALDTRLQSYIAAITKATGPRVAQEWARLGEQIARVRAHDRILDDGKAEEQALALLARLATVGDLEAVQDIAKNVLRPLLRQLECFLVRRRSREFRSRIGNSLKVGAGALHRYTKNWDQPLQRLAQEGIETQRTTVGVQELNQEKAKYWGKLWRASPSATPRAQWWPELLRRARQEERLDFETEDVTAILRRFRGRIGLGGDRTNPR